MKPAVDTHVTHRRVHANGVDIHIAEAGTGPPVLLAHGFPSCGVRGATSCLSLPARGTTRRRQTCAATAIPTYQMHRKQFPRQVFST
jgi:pimeloyl-ACP methyl ester carboxylesterase